MANINVNQQVEKHDAGFEGTKILKSNDDSSYPTPSPLNEEELLTEAEAYANAAYESALKGFTAYSHTLRPPPRPPARKRRIGRLMEIADYRRELTAMYKEAYYGVISWADLSRAAYALDSLMKAAYTEQRMRGKRGSAENI